MSNLSRLTSLGIAAAILIALAPIPGGSAPVNKALRRVAGNVGYRAAQGSPLSPVAGEQALSDDAIAITLARSKGAVTLEDSSVVALGQNTQVTLGAFNNAVAGPGSTIRLASGAMRFEIRHPQGARANYTFTTPTSSIAIRGTIGLLEAAPSGDTIVCLACEPGDVVVTVGTTKTALVSGQVLHISAPGAPSPTTVDPGLLRHFNDEGLGTTAATDDLFSTAFNLVRPAVTPGEVLIGGAAAGLLINALLNPPAQNVPPSPATGLPGNIGISSHRVPPQPNRTPAPTPTPG